MNLSGPDVTTTCGQYGRVLTLGTSYIAGIGGPCFMINPWSSYDTYTNDEIQLLEGLRDGGVTSCTRSTPTSVSSVTLSISRSRSTSSVSSRSMSSVSSSDTSSRSIRSVSICLLVGMVSGV